MLQPGRHRAAVLGAERELCCAGCEAVARTIVAAGFERYYETRSSAGVRPDALPPPEIYDDPAAQREFVAAPGEHLREATLILDRIRCAACLWLNEQALRRQPGVLAQRRRPAHAAFSSFMSKRSRFITLLHAATKSCTNFSFASVLA